MVACGIQACSPWGFDAYVRQHFCSSLCDRGVAGLLASYEQEGVRSVKMADQDEMVEHGACAPARMVMRCVHARVLRGR